MSVGASDPDLPLVSVVVPTRNRAHLLPRLFQALQEQTLTDAEWIVVDDASTDDTTAVLTSFAEGERRLSTRRTAQQSGPAHARNAGWRAARAPLIAFIDDDCVPDPGWLGALCEVNKAGSAIVQGRTEPAVENYYEWPTFARSVAVRHLTYLFESCNIAYSRALLDRLGGFDEAFGMSIGGAPNGEDADLGWRAMDDGADVAFTADAVVRHDVVALSFGRALLGKLRSHRVVFVVRRHPGLRDHLPSRYFFNESHPWALGGLVAIAAGTALGAALAWGVGVPVAAVGVLPYVWFRVTKRRLPGRSRYQPVIIAAAFVLDVADIAVLAAGSLRWRQLVL